MPHRDPTRKPDPVPGSSTGSERNPACLPGHRVYTPYSAPDQALSGFVEREVGMAGEFERGRGRAAALRWRPNAPGAVAAGRSTGH